MATGAVRRVLGVVRPLGWLLLGLGVLALVVAGRTHWRELVVLGATCLLLLTLCLPFLLGRTRVRVVISLHPARVVAGGTSDKSRGYFIRPTLLETDDAGFRTLCEEIFGPVVTAYVYDDDRWSETLELVDRTSPYALTGGVFPRPVLCVRTVLSGPTH